MNRQLARQLVAILVMGGIAVALAACGSDDDAVSRETGWNSAGVDASLSDAPFTPRVINSPNGLGVGTNRLAVALFVSETELVPEAQVTAYVYRLASDPNAEPDTVEPAGTFDMVQRTVDIHEDHQHADLGVTRVPSSEASTHPIALAQPRQDAPVLPAHEDALTTVFTTVVGFDRQGWWGLSLDVTVDGKTYRDLRVVRFVLEDPPMPIVGDAAVAAQQLTLADVDGDVRQVSSAAEPIEDMLGLTIAEAIESGRPSVIAFVTPAFCVSRFCGPILEMAVKPVWEDFGDRVNFVHVEPYVLEKARTEGQLQPVQAVYDWGLETEPFIYVIDGTGRVSAAIEGVTDEVELRQAVEAVLE